MPTANTERGLSGLRDYRLWWTGSLISGIGSAMSLVAYPLLVLVRTVSPFQAGLVGALEAVAYACLSLPAGDRARPAESAAGEPVRGLRQAAARLRPGQRPAPVAGAGSGHGDGVAGG